MPAYHSRQSGDGCREIGKLPILPMKATKSKGPAPPLSGDKDDICDEAIMLFKPNLLFRNFDVQGSTDRLLVYALLYVAACLKKIVKKPKVEAEKLLFSYALENFPLPGDAKFPLGGLCSAPASKADADVLRQYLTQLRQELNARLVERVYALNPNEPDKWWMCWSKRKFLNMEM